MLSRNCVLGLNPLRNNLTFLSINYTIANDKCQVKFFWNWNLEYWKIW